MIFDKIIDGVAFIIVAIVVTVALIVSGYCLVVYWTEIKEFLKAMGWLAGGLITWLSVEWAFERVFGDY